MHAITPYTGTLTDRAKLWTDTPGDERKRRAAAAANTHSDAELWGLVEAHVATFGQAGAKISDHTRRAYRRGVEVFVGWAQENGVNLLRPKLEDGHRFVRDLEAAKFSPSTVRVRLAAARALYRALRWSGATSADPFTDTKPAPDKTPAWEKRKPYTVAELKALLDHADVFESVLLLLCAHGGLRISEAIGLTWADVDMAAATIAVKGKGRKQRSVACSGSLIAALAKLDPVGDRLFPFGEQSARERLSKLGRHAGVRVDGFHGFRHHAGTELYRATGSLDDVARHLGHSSIETSRIYATWSDTRVRDTLAAW